MTNKFKLTKLQKAFVEVIRSFPAKRLTITTTWFDPTAPNCVGAPYNDLLEPDDERFFYELTLPAWFEDRFRFVLNFRTAKPYDEYEKTVEFFYTPAMLIIGENGKTVFSEDYVLKINEITNGDVVLNHELSFKNVRRGKSARITAEWIRRGENNQIIEKVEPFVAKSYAEVVEALWRFVGAYVPKKNVERRYTRAPLQSVSLSDLPDECERCAQHPARGNADCTRKGETFVVRNLLFGLSKDL